MTLNLGKRRYTWRNTHHLERPQQLKYIIKPAKVAGDVTKINVKSCTWQRIIQSNRTGWDWSVWGRSTGNALGVLQGSKTARRLHLQPWWQNMSWAALARVIVSRSRGVLIPTCSTLFRLHQECSVLFCSHQFRSDVEKLERAQWKATEIIRGLKNLTYEDKGTFSLEKRKLRGCNHCLKCLKDSYRENWDTPSTRMNCDSSEGSGWKLLKGKFWLGI